MQLLYLYAIYALYNLSDQPVNQLVPAIVHINLFLVSSIGCIDHAVCIGAGRNLSCERTSSIYLYSLTTDSVSARGQSLFYRFSDAMTNNERELIVELQRRFNMTSDCHRISALQAYQNKNQQDKQS